MAALIEAAVRGVQVCLLFDDMDMGARDGNFANLAREVSTLRVRVFNSAWLRSSLRAIEYLARFQRVTRRMHTRRIPPKPLSRLLAAVISATSISMSIRTFHSLITTSWLAVRSPPTSSSSLRLIGLAA